MTGSFVAALRWFDASYGLSWLTIERFVYRPMLPKPRIVVLIASIGLFICLSDLFRIIAGPFQFPFDYAPLGGQTNCWPDDPTRSFCNYRRNSGRFWGLWFIMQKTRIGFGIRAVAQDAETARAMGIDADRSIQSVFFLSSAIAAFGAIMVSILYNSVYPNMGDMIGYKGLALIVIGGFGSISGAVLAAFILGFAETIFQTYSDIPLSREGIAMAMLVLLILVRPQGLFGKA